jgi:hypothetical protein
MASARVITPLAAATTHHAFIKKWPAKRQHPNPPPLAHNLANGHTHCSLGQRPGKNHPKIMDFLFYSSGATSQASHLYG